ncbi:MAG TPA: hypothetical protein PLZ52_05830 [Bacteroidales bacterium]|nr:hypothetical protein [Bacteroidales bacterium]
MKNTGIIIFSTILIVFAVLSCSPTKTLIDQPSEYISLKLENQEDGTNGSGIAFHSGHKIYYAVIAGNAMFPLEVFSKNGDFVITQAAGVDCRGLWYNSKTRCLETNGYQNGIYCIVLGDDGAPVGESSTLVEGNTAPSENACAEYDPKNDHILFYSDGVLYKCLHSDGSLVKEIALKLPCPVYEINSTSLIYTGYKGLEIGLLNCEQNELYFFDIKSGDNTAKLKLPSQLITSCSFKFDFANDYAFFYDVATRTWTGLKIF